MKRKFTPFTALALAMGNIASNFSFIALEKKAQEHVRRLWRMTKSEERNQEKLAKQTHRRKPKRTLPKAPNRRAHRLAIWREQRGIL